MPAIPPARESGVTRTTAHPLFWARWGSAGAEPLFVLHGGPGAHHDYLLPQMLALADQYDMVFYDQRGGGRSRTNAGDPITWRTHVDDLAAVARELIGTAPTLIGYSWGGLLAMLYAVTAHRERGMLAPARLVLIDPASASSAHRAEFEREFARRQSLPWVRDRRAALQASDLRDRDPEAYRARGFALSITGYFANPEMARDLTPFRVTSRVQQSVWESLAGMELLPALRELRIPALVVHGRQDPIPVASSEAVAGALGGRLVVLDDSGHVPYVEQPAPFFAAIRTFLDATPSTVAG